MNRDGIVRERVQYNSVELPCRRLLNIKAAIPKYDFHRSRRPLEISELIIGDAGHQWVEVIEREGVAGSSIARQSPGTESNDSDIPGSRARCKQRTHGGLRTVIRARGHFQLGRPDLRAMKRKTVP